MEVFMMGAQSVNYEPQARKSALIGNSLRLALGICLTALLSSSVFAQYPGTGGGTGGGGTTGGYTAPKSGYGSGKAIGIGVGAAAGAGVAFLALHNHGAVTGCVVKTDDGLSVVDEKKNKSYAIESGSVPLNPGDRVQLKGKKSSGKDGVQSFQAKRVVKNLGSCGAQPGAASAVNP
jgi:hypothetical protein